MKKFTSAILAAGLLSAILINSIYGFIRDVTALDHLRSSVLRLHILADSDTAGDQWLKLQVRDAVLESGIFTGCTSLSDAQKTAARNLGRIENIAENTLRHYGCTLPVKACVTDMHFTERTYGDMTMPAGDYKAIRILIGSAQGHNWWCVMYPPLCLPAACDAVDDEAAVEEFFTEKENDILYQPGKYRVRFAIWDKICELTDSDCAE